jgi:DNA processing protein
MASNSLNLRSAAALLALQEIPRVGPATALRVALRNELEALGEGRIDEGELRVACRVAGERIDRWQRSGLRVLDFFDPSYPERLRTLHDPPPLLWARGEIAALDAERLVAVIGTREPSTFGRTAAEALTKAVCADGWGVVSGLARGCDTIAHREALAMGAPTIAVMGGGLDSVYPAENETLAEAIVAAGGVLVAEQPPGAPPSPGNLIRRDRLQSGLGVAVLLCQTEPSGGSMHTVRYAAEQGRPIFVPDPAGSNGKSSGLRLLLERPAAELCDVLPAWRNARRLSRRLGDARVARPIARDDLQGMIGGLHEALAHERSRPAGETPELAVELLAA